MILLTLFLTFCKIGAFTFGGGFAMLPLIRQEVARQGWMQDGELLEFIAVSESTPGPFAVNMATYVGSRIAGFPGALLATLGVVLPSFLMILIVAKCFDAFKKNRIVKGCMSGLKPATVGLIGAALISVGKSAFFPGGVSVQTLGTPAFWISLGIFAVCALLAFRKVHPILLIVLSAGLGVLAGYTLL